jgi:hypothetical protein
MAETAWRKISSTPGTHCQELCDVDMMAPRPMLDARKIPSFRNLKTCCCNLALSVKLHWLAGAPSTRSHGFAAQRARSAELR